MLVWFKKHTMKQFQYSSIQSCKSGGAFRVGPKVDKILGLIRAWDVLFVLGAQKYNQNNLAITLTFFRPNLTFGFFGYDLDFKLVFRFGPGSDLLFRLRAWTSCRVYNSGSIAFDLNNK